MVPVHLINHTTVKMAVETAWSILDVATEWRRVALCSPDPLWMLRSGEKALPMHGIGLCFHPITESLY
jgi:hypothetical protein